MSVNPVGFLVCDKTHVKMISMDDKGFIEHVADGIPEIFKAIFNKDNDKKDNC